MLINVVVGIDVKRTTDTQRIKVAALRWHADRLRQSDNLLANSAITVKGSLDCPSYLEIGNGRCMILLLFELRQFRA